MQEKHEHPATPLATNKLGVLKKIDMEQDIERREFIQKGTNNRVYRGLLRKKEMVAIRIIITDTPEIIESLNKEMELHATLLHPNIIKLMDYNTTHSVLELANQGDLVDFMACNRLTLTVKKKLANNIIDAVGYLHERRIIHCDLKPENILINYQNSTYKAKLCDFEYAKMLPQSTNYIMIKPMGTPKYLAPEAWGSGDVGIYSEKSDVWSLGGVFFTMVCLESPYHDIDKQYRDCTKAMQAIGRAILAGELPHIPLPTPEEFKESIEHCWKYKRNERPSISELRNLSLFASQNRTTSTTPPPVQDHTTEVDTLSTVFGKSVPDTNDGAKVIVSNRSNSL